MDLSDITYVAYLIICALIALGISGGGGGKRSRLRAAAMA
jgi:hypothetical protein